MKRFQHVLTLLPSHTDGSNAIAWAKMIARAAGARKVDLISCTENHLPDFPPLEGQDSLLQGEHEKLSQWATGFEEATETEVFVETGNPLKLVLAHLAAGTYDLVILPVCDLDSRLFAERLARKSPVGILLVPADCPPAFTSILTAIDLSDLSELALEWAEAFSSLAQQETRLEALHVMKLPMDSRATMAISRDHLRREIHQSSLSQLTRLVRKTVNNAKSWKLTITENPLASMEIVRTATEVEADLVIIGSHGRGALSVTLLGGQTAEVIRNCDRPVLVVKKKNETLGILRQLIGLSK
ncbi:universal stress protein [Roseibacillus persicicus]|uniref:universal stress protein n=1 Tax=Roseibacillus persicicus TaxID=454148 RepID=UPI0028100070|nr:universal stress protein [Roseibacillus persicicus]MDQ8189829.1 universal stress protein [Roseibacillus persicicus]